VKGNLSSVGTETLQEGCINATNVYRDYAQSYDMYYKLLCDVPNQDTTVIDGKATEIYQSNETAEHCLPMVVPELAAQGTGVCRLSAAMTLTGNSDDFAGEYYDRSAVFNVTPTFPINTVTLYQDGIPGEFTGMFSAPRTYTNETMRIDIAQTTFGEYGLDKFKSAYITYNGTNASCFIGTGMVSTYDIPVQQVDPIMGIPTASRNPEFHCSLGNMTIPAGASFDLTVEWFSQVTWYGQILTALSGLVTVVQQWMGIGGTVGMTPIGNYTAMTSALETDAVGSSPLVVQFNMTGGNSSARRNLHFVYEFAPVVDGKEDAFVDQNPSIEGYQALSVYQAIRLNQTKSFALTLSPNLPIGNYTMYETVYESENAQPVSSGDQVRDERIIEQKTYGISVDQQMTPEFDGNVMRLEGVTMQALS